MTLLEQALKERRISGTELAKRVSMTGPAIRRYIRGEIKPNIDLAAKIAAALEMDEGELWGVASSSSNGRTVPVYGITQNGLSEDITDMSSPLDYQRAPPSVRVAGYGVIVAGESMAPRLGTGDVAFVSPGYPVRPGDLVVAQFKVRRGETLAIVKQYKSRDERELVLQQLNPPLTIKLDIKKVACTDRVVTVDLH